MIFRYTILYVDDVPASFDFYQRAFGMTLGFLHEGEDYGELVTGETKLAFSSKALMTQLGKNPAKADPAGPVFELAFEVDDVAGALAVAVQAGADLVQDAREEPWGQTTSYVSDPDGYLIELCSPIHVPSAG
jgi:catechol 2,3-dioxygenase-like lactoylglutathione lyase family enzyme